MKLDEFGAYILLLAEAWLDGARLPDNDDELRYDVLDIEDDKQWQRIKKFVIDRMFIKQNGSLVNSRQLEVWAEVQSKCLQNKNRAKTAAEGRWGTPESDEESVFAFADFWNCYDKKVERAKCERIYAKIPETKRTAIKERLPHYVKATPDKNFRKNPQTWLNNSCWDDEIVMPNTAGSSHNIQNAPNWSTTEKDDDVNSVF